VWDWAYLSDKYAQHHNLAITPKGTVLFRA
jgi:hypothetical protein